MSPALRVLALSFLLVSRQGRCAPAAEPALLPVAGPFEVSCLLGMAPGKTSAAKDALVEYANQEFSAFYWALGPAKGTVAPLSISTGLAAQADLGYHLANGGILGLRIGAVYTLAGAILNATNLAGDRLQETWALDVVMVPLLAGGWIEHALSSDVTLRGSLFAGPAFGKSLLLYAWDYSGPSANPSIGGAIIPYRAATFAADLGAEFNWKWTRNLTLVVDAGYRYCTFIAMRASQNVDTSGDGKADVFEGDAFADGRGRSVPFNFSGFKATLGLRWRFDR